MAGFRNTNVSRRLRSLLLLGLGSGLAAQMPPGWDAQLPLGQAEGSPSAWYGFGLWSADQHGGVATLDDSLGMGNAITGNGFHLEGGLRTQHWDLAAELMGGRKQGGGDFATLYRGHATWRSQDQGGWEAGLEREPLVWGYGLNGGYLLGDAARPFPRFRVESPMADLHLWRVPLGAWGFQAFMGRLENGAGVSPSIQDPLYSEARIAAQGDPQAPFLNGYRFQAKFGPDMEFYANYINLWGGTLNGVSMTQGYGIGDYLTSMFGLKDTLAESNLDPNDPNAVGTYKNKARSASNCDVGFRMRIRPMEDLLRAETVHAYVSRGSKNVWWNPGTFFRNPPKYLAKDVSNEGQDLGQGRYSMLWNRTNHYAAPNLTSPNDTVGVLMDWSGVRLGLEYLDTVNNTSQGVRSFTHYLYLSGFYTYGDPLGNAVAGEARTTTARLEANYRPNLTGTTILQVGSRPFRDDLALWQAAYNLSGPVDDRFVGLQQTLKWQCTRRAALGLGSSWQHHSAVSNIPGNSANAFRYYADLTYRWPAL